MRASGDVWIPMALSMAAIIFVEVPAALILSQFYGLDGVWWAICLSFCTALLTSRPPTISAGGGRRKSRRWYDCAV